MNKAVLGGLVEEPKQVKRPLHHGVNLHDVESKEKGGVFPYD